MHQGVPHTDEQQPPGLLSRTASYLGDVGKNLGPSAGRVLGDFYQVLRHPVQTAGAVWTLGRGLVELAIPGEGENPGNEEMAREVGRYFMEKYGSMEAVQQSFRDSPTEVAADLAMLVGGGAGLLAKTSGKVGSIASRVANAAQKADVANLAVAGTRKVAQALPNLPASAGRIASQSAGVLPGTGDIGIRAGVQVGREVAETGSRAGIDDFLRAMNSEAGGLVDADIVQKALDALTDIRTNRTASYQTDMGKFKLKEIDVDTQRVFDKLDELEKSTATSAGGIPEPKFSAKLQRIEEMRELAEDFITQKGGVKASDMDELKKMFGDMWSNPGDKTGSNRANRAVQDMQDVVRDMVLEKVPDYADTMAAYSATDDLIKSLERNLSMTRNATEQQTLRRLLGALRDGVNTNMGGAIKQVEKLGDPSLMPLLAGTQFRNVVPTGMARFMRPGTALGAGGAAGLFTGSPLVGAGAAGLTALASSPRVVGRGSVLAGQALGSPLGQRVGQAWRGGQVGAPRLPSSPFGPTPPVNVPGFQQAVSGYFNRAARPAQGLRPLQAAFDELPPPGQANLTEDEREEYVTIRDRMNQSSTANENILNWRNRIRNR